ncbi:hypothetical protein BKA70DRAFT_1341808, partial [Coprinopsis sp. MPI-PUGE-AT-0042]
PGPSIGITAQPWTPASELEKIVATSPPELTPYVSCNDAVPSHLLTCLETYLLRLSEPTERLEAEINALEELLKVKRRIHERARASQDAHLRMKAPIRRVPLDVLEVIFPFAIDIPPFNRYIDVAHLRGVCSSWRHVAKTTPGLWTSLDINLDKWCGAELDRCNSDRLSLHFENALAPWISILGKSIPYQLNITSNNGYCPDRQISRNNLLVDYLFHLTPSPSVVTLSTWAALSGALSSRSSATHTLKIHAARMALSDKIHVEPAFPNLKILSSDCPMDCNCLSLGHSSLAILHLGDISGTPTSFMRMMQGLPALHELKLYSSKTFDVDDDDTPNSPTIHSHSRLEVLLVKGEDLLFLFRSLACPALRFLIVEGLDLDTAQILTSEILRQILATSESSSRVFTISFRGRLCVPFVEQTITSLPANSYIHFAPSSILNPWTSHRLTDGMITIESNNVEAIYCDTRTGDVLSMLNDSANQNSRPLTIYTPSDIGNTEAHKRKWEALKGAGYHLELRSADQIDSMLRSLAPEYSPESPWG